MPYMGHTWTIHGPYMGHTWAIHAIHAIHTDNTRASAADQQWTMSTTCCLSLSAGTPGDATHYILTGAAASDLEAGGAGEVVAAGAGGRCHLGVKGACSMTQAGGRAGSRSLAAHKPITVTVAGHYIDLHSNQARG
jgi:hypothetical protein